MLAQKLILSYSSRIFVQFVQISATIVVARVAGAGVLGTVAFGLSYVTMFSFVANLGFGTAHIKKLSEGRDKARCIGTFARIKVGLLFLYVLCVTVFFLVQRYIFHTSFESPDHITVIFILLVQVAFSQLFFIPKTTFAAFTQQAKSDIPNLIRTLLYQIFRIIIVLLGYRAVALAFGNLVSAVLISPLYIYLFREYKIGPFDRKLAKEYFKIALPVMLTGMTSTLSHTIDKVLLQFFTESAQVGYYSAGFRIGGFVLLIATSISTLFFPIFSKAASEKDFLSIKTYIEKFERFSFIYVMPFVVLVTLFAEDIVRILLGREYLASIPVMMVINVTMFLRVINTPYSSVIVGLGYFNKGLQIGIWNFIFYITALLVLIHPALFHGAGFGAALALLLSSVLMLILYRVYAKKYVPILSNRMAVVYMLFGSVDYLLFYVLLKKTLIFPGLWKILFVVVYVSCTYLSMIVLKLARKEDWKYLKMLLDYRKMKTYIKSEILNKKNI